MFLVFVGLNRQLLFSLPGEVEMTKRIALSLAGIVAVTHILQGCAGVIVAGGAAGAATIATDARTTGTLVDDQAIEFRITSGFQSDKDLAEKTHISVVSYNRVVLLSGEVPTAELRSRAYNIVKEQPDVKRIFNEIHVAQPLPLRARNYDTWLTAKVKTKLLGTENLNALNIKVVTSNTTVYLMGLLSREQAQKAAETASSLNGVSKVVKAFEYSD